MSACFEKNRSSGGASALFKKLELKFDPKWGKLPQLHSQLEIHRISEFRRIEDSLLADVNLDAKVVSIAEPGGKYRILSKGSGYLYSYVQPIQGALLSSWKGRAESTMLDQDLTDHVSTIWRNRYPDFQLLASVDYKSATDLLQRHGSFEAASGIPEPWRNIVQASLCQGRLIYKDGSVIVQGEGQLMGHPISFPLLCTINLSCYRSALNRWANLSDWDSPEWFLRKEYVNRAEHTVIVNGDDMLFPCNDLLYQIFCEECAKVGFRFSAGKNYLSTSYCLINSQLFRRRGDVFSRIHYLNQRLILGKCLKSGVSIATPDQIAKCTSEMVRALPWTTCVVPSIMRRWSGKFRGQSPNWYIPKHLGGFGMDIDLAPPSLRITRTQRQVAALFVRDPKLVLCRMKIGTKLDQNISSLIPEGKWTEGSCGNSPSSELADRLRYVNRWCQMGCKPVEPDENPIYFYRHRFYARLHPISVEGFLKYWTRSMVFNNDTPVPKLQGFPPRISFSIGDTPWIRFALQEAHGVASCDSPNRWSFDRETATIW
jgi:hypothetical protein